MELKQKQKYLAPYLPYGLKLQREGHKEPYHLVSASYTPPFFNGVNIDDTFFDGETFERFIPILRPLSDLTKEIEHNGEKLTPIVELKLWVKADVDDVIGSPLNCEYYMVQKLFEWRMDVFGLIESGLAVDVNQLEENPYK